MNSSTARIGYARISTVDQNLYAQIAALKAAGCNMIQTETGSGSSLEGRPELGTIHDFIHPGETLVVTRIDRLARSLRDLQVIVAKLKERGAHLAATEQPVDTSSATGLRRSTWTRSGAGLLKASHRLGSPAIWGSRAEPCTRRRAWLKRMTNHVRTGRPIPARSCRKKRHKSPTCSPCVLSDVHICSFGPFGPTRRVLRLGSIPVGAK